MLCARKWVGLGAGLNDQRVAVRVSPFVAVCEGLVGMAVLYGMRCIECMNISKIGCAEISILQLYDLNVQHTAVACTAIHQHHCEFVIVHSI